MTRRHRKDSSQAEVNMTPMLDIVFIMLIFFIVTSTFVREQGLDVTQPNNNENQQQQKNKARAVFIQVCADEEVIIGNRAIDVRSVRANVERKLAENPNSVVIIQPEKKANTGSLVQVMDQVREANAKLSIAPSSKGCS